MGQGVTQAQWGLLGRESKKYISISKEVVFTNDHQLTYLKSIFTLYDGDAKYLISPQVVDPPYIFVFEQPIIALNVHVEPLL